ncbi:MAG: cyclic nucleotide-binding domain-containing protein, partial [Planctomycetes bacterium]|nr:cyclic nucleotide-binding domain-containing protein [Planctomycetota bacterium]
MGKNIKKLQVVVPEGEVLFDEGETTKEMYILLKGEVEVMKGELSIAKINANGSFIGEMATLLDAPRTARVRTTQKSVLLKVEPEDVDVLFKVTPELGYSLSKSLAERLAIMTSQVSKAGSAPGEDNEEEDEKVSAEEIKEAEKVLEEEEDPPEDLNAVVQFLTRTEVHKNVMRYYFNNIGVSLEVNHVIEEVDLPDMLVKLVLAEYKKAEFIK